VFDNRASERAYSRSRSGRRSAGVDRCGRGTPTIAEETIAEALDPDSEREAKRFRLRDLFKGKTKGKNGKARSAMHPAWGRIITVSGGIAQLAFTVYLQCYPEGTILLEGFGIL
jgi:hypothetical protein